jgi:dipeptidyl aminopeptidase/acylaminoacyl peptidase
LSQFDSNSSLTCYQRLQFRQSLRGNWGIIDIADVCNGALWCVKEGLVHGSWLCIDGRSAGGYTTMAALTFKDVFSAGASLYGVSDLVTLAQGEYGYRGITVVDFLVSLFLFCFLA